MTATSSLVRKLTQALPVIFTLTWSVVPFAAVLAAPAPVQPVSGQPASPASTQPLPSVPASAPVIEAGVTLSPRVAARLPELRTFSSKMGVPMDQLLLGMEGTPAHL